MMFRWTIKQPGIQKFWNLWSLYQDIYDWISPLNKWSGRPFILTQQSMRRNKYGISGHLQYFRFFEALSQGDLRTICRFSYMKVYKLITLGTKFKTLLSLGRKSTMFSKFITNYIEQGWWHSSLTLKCMHLLLKEVNKRGRHAYNLHFDELVYQVVL